ncbi:MAG: hypothetical protein GY859_39370 [Desulfobacterales bacterium]|nr:hypothetical protein [Desulfobacterales bacterium]
MTDQASGGVLVTAIITATSEHPLSGIPGLTPSQYAAAVTLEEINQDLEGRDDLTPQQQDLLDVTNLLIDNAGENPGAAARAFDAINPEEATASIHISTRTAVQQVDNMNARLLALHHGARGSPRRAWC